MTVRADAYFAIVPEWVLFADVSANAVRLYAVLRRYADKEDRAHPSRRTLADRMHCSADTVDRVLKELVEIGAVSVEKRAVEGSKEADTNVYTCRSVRPGSRKDAATGSRKDAQTGSRTSAAENQSQLNQTKTTAEPTTSAAKNDDAYFDRGRWEHLLSQLHRRGWTDEGTGALTWPYLMAMRKRYGTAVVDRALSEAQLDHEAPAMSSAAYFGGICERIKAAA